MTDAPSRLTLRRPDDWHVHLRDGAMLHAVLPATARVFGRAIVMPNLKPPITRVDQAIAYRDRILEALPEGCLLYTSPSPRDKRQSRMPSSA